MGPLPITPGLPFTIFMSLWVAIGIMAMTVYIHRCMKKQSTPFWKGSRVPTLPLPWSYIVICLLILAVNGALALWMLPIAGIFLSAFVIISYRKIPSHFWHLQVKDVSKYFKISAGIFLIVIVPLQLTAALSDAVLSYFHVPVTPQDAIDQLFESKNPKDIFLFFLDAALIAPIWEEIIFRGFLHPLFKSKIGKNYSLILVSLLFALVHYHLPTFVPLALFGMILGWTYEKQGSLGYPIVLHAIFNAFSATSVLLLR